MPLEAVVPAPPLLAPIAGLLSVAEVVEHPIDEREDWLRSIRYQPESTSGVELLDPCGAVPALTGANTHRPPRVGLPFEIVCEDTCSSWGWSQADYEGRATRGLLAKESTGLEREWERGTLIVANPHLADNTDPYLVTLNAGAATSPRDALALLDEAIANSAVIIGRGMIHATPYVVALWASLFPQLDTDAKTGAMLSPGGNFIIGGNGYLGASPANVVDATHAVQWAYATDLVVVHRSDRPTIYPEGLDEALDRKVNTVTYRATRPYAIAWSGLLHAAVSVAVTPSASGAAGSALVDVSDRAARLNGLVDVSDSAARLLGVVSGSVSTAPTGTPVAASSTTAVAAALTATLAAAAAKTTYLAGFVVTGAGATAGSVVNVTVTGCVGGPLNFALVVPAGAGASVTPLQVDFSRPIAGSAVNTAVVVNVPSFGAGNVTAAVTAYGFQL